MEPPVLIFFLSRRTYLININPSFTASPTYFVATLSSFNRQTPHTSEQGLLMEP